jgi:hypothetical protein
MARRQACERGVQRVLLWCERGSPCLGSLQVDARRDRRRCGQQTTAGTRRASPEAIFWQWSGDVFLQRLEMQQRSVDG